MLLNQSTLAGITAGTISRVFRRWQRPLVSPGSTFRTSAGVVVVDRIEAVAMADLSPLDARRAGHASLGALRADLAGRTGTVHRIALRLAGPDPRLALRKDVRIGADVVARLDRLDAASRGGAWTRATLRSIARQPGVRAADLAAQFGLATLPFKQRVRRLKEFGLTESLEVGYRLSPRGRALLRRVKGET